MPEPEDPRDPTPIKIGLREPQVQLAIMVPSSVKRAVRRTADLEGVTVRGLILQILKRAGIAEIAETEIADQRAVTASVKAKLFRDAQRR